MDIKKEIHLSVRHLVEFIFRGGDLDNRRKISPELAMSEGNRIHRMLQKKGGAGYHAEVELKWRYETADYDLCLEGRADGIMEDYIPEEWQEQAQQLPLFAEEYGLVESPEPMTYIDEIKATYQNLRYIKEPYQVHLAQAKCYAYIVTKEDALEQIGIRVTYCNIEDHGMKYFHQVYTADELAAWFEETVGECRKWVDYSLQWKALKIPSIHALQFPYAYREGQKELASYVYQTIYHGKKLFFGGTYRCRKDTVYRFSSSEGHRTGA